ncbi:MAG TPA: hypothetical protein VJ689_10905, partial [Gaiellaceae bacterium]|nr:hypothetical protein [Gaiellaceae bacterium]
MLRTPLTVVTVAVVALASRDAFADRRAMKALACVLALPLAFVGWQWWGDHSAERALSPVASEIAGRRVTVSCQSLWGSLLDVQARHGEVRFDAAGVPEPRIFLTRDTCRRLRAYRGHARHLALDCLRSLDWQAAQPLSPTSACYAESSDTIYALLVLAHEAYHTAGVTNEATANCYAIQAMAYAAVRLGAAEDEARLTARAMAALEPYQRGAYATSECRHGTALDLRPETPDFPSEPRLSAPRGL